MPEKRPRRHLTIEIDDSKLSAAARKKVETHLAALRMLAKSAQGLTLEELAVLGLYKKRSQKHKDFGRLIDSANKLHEELDTRKRRYLKREDWADPNKSPQAEVNVSSKKVRAQVSLDHVEQFNRIAEHFPDKRAALERAIELLAAAEPEKPPVRKEAKQMAPRVSEAHLELFNNAAEKYPTRRLALERAVELLVTEIGNE